MSRPRIRILHAIRQGKIGGGESHVLDLVASLDPSGFESFVLAFTPGPMIDRMREMGVKTYVIPTERPFDLTVRKKVFDILESEHISILHAHGTRACSNTYSSARKAGIPLVYTVHGWSFHRDQSPFVRRLRIWSERFLVRQANVTICVSESNRHEGLAHFSMGESQVIEPGIDLSRFDPEKEDSSFRQSLHVGDNEVLVGYIVRMTKQKDPFTLLKAIALLPENIPARFLFIGDGDLKMKAIQLAKESGVSERVVFMDFRQDVPKVLKGIDIYCLPSLWEGLPIGLLEAMAMGKAVVATSVDGTCEAISHLHNGLLVPVQAPGELAEKLERLIRDESLRRRLGAEAKKTIRDYFTLERMTKQIENVYMSFPHGGGTS